MKNTLLPILLLFLIVGACHKDATIGPSDLLYQRWHLFQTRDASSSVWMPQDTGSYYDVEFRPDGTVIYYKDGAVTATPCCAGSRFERKGVLIQYSEFPACLTVYCAPGTATITILKEDLLELQNGNRLLQYRPVK